MRTPLHGLTIAATSARLPAPAETTRVAIGESGPRGRGDHLDLPAFSCDPRLDPDLPAHLRRRIDRFSALAYLATAEALHSIPNRPARERIGVFFANTRAGWSYGEPELEILVRQGFEFMHAYQATAWFPAAAQGETTIALDLRGCAKTSAGRYSGFGEALWMARDALERGAIDLALVGATESLVNGFVLRDWAQHEPLPTTGPAEGAVVLALRRGDDGLQLHDLNFQPSQEQSEVDWSPTLSAAARLRAAALAGVDTTVSLGGGYWITIKGAQVNAVLSEFTSVGDLAVEARHELVIAGPVAEVFEMTRDVNRWTAYMPAVTCGSFVEQTEGSDIVEITAEANDQKHTWRSRRTIDRTEWTIEFHRVDPVAPLVQMQGRWRFVPVGDKTLAILTHRYATTTGEALHFFNNATRSNATRDLEGLAAFFQNREDNQ